MLLVVLNLLLQLLKLLLLLSTNVEVLVGLLAFAEGVPLLLKRISINARHRSVILENASGAKNLPLSRTPRPSCPSVSFAHSAGGGGEGSAGWVYSAAETWSKGLDDGLAEHDGCRQNRGIVQ